MKDVADALARLNELGRPDLAEPIHFLMGERDGLMKALASAKTVMESKDKAYSLIQQRWDAMAAKAATVDSERECNEKLTAEVDALTARVASIDDHGTRHSLEGMGPLSVQVAEVIKDVNELRHPVGARFDAHDRKHEQEESRRISARRWAVATVIAAVAAVDGPLVTILLARR